MALTNCHQPHRQQAHYKPMSNWSASAQEFRKAPETLSIEKPECKSHELF